MGWLGYNFKYKVAMDVLLIKLLKINLMTT